MRIKLFLLLLFTIAITSSLYAQSVEHSHDHEHDEEGEVHQHEHPDSEIGIGNSIVYFAKEKEYAYGFHIHYVKSIPNSKLGIGFGYERIFDDHGHNTFGPELVYRPIEMLSVSLSPGVILEDEHPEAKFAAHIETSYEFELHNFHIGPTIGFAYDKEDHHFSIGIHIGYGF